MKHQFKTTTGKVLSLSENEIDMVLYFESKGLAVDSIGTKDGVTEVVWRDGSSSKYQPITFKN